MRPTNILFCRANYFDIMLMQSGFGAYWTLPLVNDKSKDSFEWVEYVKNKSAKIRKPKPDEKRLSVKHAIIHYVFDKKKISTILNLSLNVHCCSILCRHKSPLMQSTNS
jgi:hypothetical protein